MCIFFLMLRYSLESLVLEILIHKEWHQFKPLVFKEFSICPWEFLNYESSVL